MRIMDAGASDRVVIHLLGFAADDVGALSAELHCVARVRVNELVG